MNQPKRLFIGLLVAALAGAGWVYYQAQARQAATLSRISALENRLISSNEQRAGAAKRIVSDLSEAVRKNHNQFSGVVVLKQAQEIQARTDMLIDTLQQLRQSWKIAGSKIRLGRFPARLNQYAHFIEKFAPDSPLLNHDSIQVGATNWLDEFDTVTEPKPAALALLTRLETQIRQIEAEALMNQAIKVVFEGVFEKVGAFVAPTSQTVTPGAVYQAQLLLASINSTSQVRFSADGHELPVAPDFRHAAVQFKTPAARPGQPDTVRATWHGRVQLPWAAGDTVLETTVPYFIVKPPHR